MYRHSVLLLMVALLGTEVKMHPVNLGIKPSMKQCAGTLGSVHYEGGHMLVLASPGVNTGLSMDGRKQKVTFTNQLTRRSAVITLDSPHGLVWVKNVYGKINSRIMCIQPD
jgi:hypothetical protein